MYTPREEREEEAERRKRMGLGEVGHREDDDRKNKMPYFLSSVVLSLLIFGNLIVVSVRFSSQNFPPHSFVITITGGLEPFGLLMK